jgi:3-dehydroquinate synthase
MTSTTAAAIKADTPAAVTVPLGARSYVIHVGQGLLARAADLISPVLKQRRVFIVTDGNVAQTYLQPLAQNLSRAGIRTDHVIVPAGEASKDFAHLAQLTEAMLKAKCERSTMIVALGGGVIGDLTGFAAAVLLRGVEFIQIPTTLLAQVDSSVGGKTGINTPAGKNLVGAFHQPRLVIADTDTLATLPRRELLAGYAEVAKYGLLGDAAFWQWLENNGVTALGPGGHEALRQCIVASCEAKARIVAADEREDGVRALLNLGHTFAHALEAEAGYGAALLHGEAVAVGMVLAFDLSVRMGLCPAADAQRVRAHFAAAGLKTTLLKQGIHGPTTPERLIGHMVHDKKNKDGAITFILVRGIGKAFISQDVPRPQLEATLAAALGA